MRAEIGSVVIHPKYDDSPEWEFSLETTETLECVQNRLTESGFEAGTLDSEDYGRYLLISDPDGATIRINEIVA